MAAVWSEKGQVEIFDLRPQLEAVHSSAVMAAFIKRQKEATPLFSFSGHMTEGFAIDWSPKVPGECLCLWPTFVRQSDRSSQNINTAHADATINRTSVLFHRAPDQR